MASVLSLSPSPIDFGGYDGNPSFRHSFSSFATNKSDDTLHHCRHRHLSISSFLTRSSSYAHPIPPKADFNFAPASTIRLPRDASPSRLSSCSDLSASPSFALSEYSASLVKLSDHHNDDIANEDQQIDHEHQTCRISWPFAEEEESHGTAGLWHQPVETQDEIDLSFIEESSTTLRPTIHSQSPAFRRWVSTLRRRNPANQIDSGLPLLRQIAHGCDPGYQANDSDSIATEHRRSGSHVSSMAFVTGTRSASMTMTTMSLPSINAPASVRSPRSMMYLTSNPASRTDLRRSTDSDNAILAPVLDDAALKRSHKRARKIQELVRTEEGYLSDLKCLQNVLGAYFTILLPHALSTPRVAAAQACVSDLQQLHEDILLQLQIVARQLTPYKITSKAQNRTGNRPRLYAIGARCLGSSPDSKANQFQRERSSFELSRGPEGDLSESLCTPQLAGEVARIFSLQARRLVVYEEYGVRCDSMQLDVDLQRSPTNPVDYDRALEALQASVCPSEDRAKALRKALGLKDLLIKPIQRITRYELLFKDLCTLTPSCDDPSSHAALDDALFVISQTCHDLNEASGSTEKLKVLDSQRRLEKKLHFDKPIVACLQDVGRLLLCGALYIAYRGTTSIKGQYAICILYESCLFVATKGPSKYHVILAISLAQASIEEPDNGKSLQCHTTPHTWKVAFESEGALFEILCVACSAIEAETWRHRISGRIAVEAHYSNEGRTGPIEFPSPLTDEMRSVGKAYGRGAHFNRRASVQRAATLGPLTELNQVIIKNTQAAGKDTTASSCSLPMPRSQSVLTPSHISVLAPRRSDRIHLEAMLIDVWTKDALPFPGMGPKRGEYSMRASANHVIRKLSIASITSNFSKRSVSLNGVSQIPLEDRVARARVKPRNPPPKPPKRPVEKKVINFHTAPEAFLPEDFELKNPAKARGRLAGLRTFTMGTERPRAGFWGPLEDEKAADAPIKRSRSVITRRRCSDFDTERLKLAAERSQTAMSTPAVLTAATRPAASRTETGETETKTGMRQRAKSKLARLLG